MQTTGLSSIPFPTGMELLEDGQHSQEALCKMLKDVKGFEEFEQSDLAFLAKHMKAFRAEAGSTIFREGDRNSYLNVLIEGQAGVYKEDSDDKVKFLASMFPSRIFGEISAIDNLPSSASVVAETDAVIITMSRESFRKCIYERPNIGVRLLDHIAHLLCARLRSVSNQLVDYIDV
jgi:CRP/FNR family transcriptional regulator